MIDRTHRWPWIATFDLADQLILLDLRGAWPAGAGASQKLATGPRIYAQAWAQTIYSQYAEPGHIQGIIYPSAMLGGGVAGDVTLAEHGDRLVDEFFRWHRQFFARG